MIEEIIGIVSGIVSGIGMGGGIILILLLELILNAEHHTAQASNLIFFIPTAISAIVVNIKNKNIDFKSSILVSIFGIIGAIIGAKLATFIDVKNLKIYFGFFLILIIIYEIYRLNKG